MKFVLKSACQIQPSERLAEATMGNLSTKDGVLCLVMSGEVGLCIKVKFIEYVKTFICLIFNHPLLQSILYVKGNSL